MKRPTGPKARPGTLASDEARRAAVAVLQVMAGELRPSEASARLSLSVNRYYQLEARALEAMVEALEPRARGRRRGRDVELEKLRKAKTRAEHEATRFQALLRVSQRALALSAPTPGPSKDKPPLHGGRKARRARVRARTVISTLSGAGATMPATPPVPQGTPDATPPATSGGPS